MPQLPPARSLSGCIAPAPRSPRCAACCLLLPPSSDSCVGTAQAFLPATLPLAFCNHEILMTESGVKVQSVSESSGGQGTWNGRALPVAATPGAGLCGSSQAGTACGGLGRGAAGSLCTGTQVSGARGSGQGTVVFTADMQVAAGCCSLLRCQAGR